MADQFDFEINASTPKEEFAEWLIRNARGFWNLGALRITIDGVLASNDVISDEAVASIKTLHIGPHPIEISIEQLSASVQLLQNDPVAEVAAVNILNMLTKIHNIDGFNLAPNCTRSIITGMLIAEALRSGDPIESIAEIPRNSRKFFNARTKATQHIENLVGMTPKQRVLTSMIAPFANFSLNVKSNFKPDEMVTILMLHTLGFKVHARISIDKRILSGSFEGTRDFEEMTALVDVTLRMPNVKEVLVALDSFFPLGVLNRLLIQSTNAADIDSQIATLRMMFNSTGDACGLDFVERLEFDIKN